MGNFDQQNILVLNWILILIVSNGGSVENTTRARTIKAPCIPGYFACNSSDTCVEQKYNCDGNPDCEDGSDELKCDDVSKDQFWNSLFKKRWDEDREEKIRECDFEEFPRVCRCSYRSLFCVHSRLKTLPHPLPKTLVELDMSGNNITELNQKHFPYLEKLEMLIISTSNLYSIGRHTFSKLPSLTRLYLQGNRLRSIKNETFGKCGKLDYLTLSHNPLTTLYFGSFKGLPMLQELDLRDCQLNLLPVGIFDPLVNLRHLWLDGNQIEIILPSTFSRLRKLQILSLSHNRIRQVTYESFEGLSRLHTLSLAFNLLQAVNANTFGNQTYLQILDLQSNRVKSIDSSAFAHFHHLQSLNLRKNPIKKLVPEVFLPLQKLTHIYFEEFRFCSYALHVRVCEPRGDGISSFAHLLDSLILRASVWVVAGVACCGNCFVLLGRFLISEPNAVHSFYIKNLSVADLLMGVYLFIIAGYDVAFRGEYLRHEENWRHSWQCNLCGFLSTLSSEASVLILTTITLDRYLSITHPLTVRRRTIKSAWSLMAITWLIAILLSSLPITNLDYYGDEFYGNNGVCLPLHIHDPYGQAWEYSVFVFCGVNSFAFALVLYAYLRMFTTITQSRLGLRSSHCNQHDKTIAKRFAFIVGTDFFCWVPIIFVKFLVLGGVQIDADLYAWVAVFLLPVNSALNPVLYTLTTKLFKQQFARIVYSWRTSSSCDASAMSLSSILSVRTGAKRIPSISYSESDSHTSKSSLLSHHNRCIRAQHQRGYRWTSKVTQPTSLPSNLC